METFMNPRKRYISVTMSLKSDDEKLMIRNCIFALR